MKLIRSVLIFAAMGLGLAACGTTPSKDTPATAQGPVAAVATPASSAEVLSPAVLAGPSSEKTIDAVSPPVPAHIASKRGSVPADKSLGWLKNGNKRFIKGSLRSDGQSAKDRERLSSGQNPHAIVLSCSDSRVPPEIIFDQKLGEIFVVRAAGEVLDASTIASIEYAVAHLESNLILVMGHDSCGAVHAAHSTLNGSDAGSPWLNKLVADIHPRIRSFAGKPLSEGGVVEAWANAEGVAKDLVARSQIVRDALNTGEVKIQTALYHLKSGEVDFK